MSPAAPPVPPTRRLLFLIRHPESRIVGALQGCGCARMWICRALFCVRCGDMMVLPVESTARRLVNLKGAARRAEHVPSQLAVAAWKVRPWSEHTLSEWCLEFQTRRVCTCAGVCLAAARCAYTMPAQQIQAFTDYWLIQQHYTPL